MDLHHRWQQTWQEQLATVRTEADLLAVLASATCELGFEYCALGMRLPLPLSNPRTLMLGNYSPAWSERYASAQYLNVDPTVAHALVSTEALLWSDEVFVNTAELWEDARDYDLRIGWAQPAHDIRGIASLLTLARSHEPVSPIEMSDKALQVAWLARATHETLAGMLASGPDSVTKLTEREVEVLRWAGDGKTAAQTAHIVGITERTVIFHIDNALRKLGAANKTAGVLKAALLRLI
ncbi:MAG TPA: LuxR family transcriptional regulator [Janthinobacterium sp.]|jgi:LuxR family transcriptional regulator|nr:LuxR family transcriptional regulator [Janthinobacterium sp.]